MKWLYSVMSDKERLHITSLHAVIEAETFPHRVFTLGAAIEMMLYVVVFRKHFSLQMKIQHYHSLLYLSLTSDTEHNT